MATFNSKRLIVGSLIGAALLAFFGLTLHAHALSTYQTVQGGTGTTSPSGILNGKGSSINTLLIGTGLSFDGTTLSATGGTNYWTSLGQAIYNNTGTAVGINLTNPTAPLEVQATTTGGTVFQVWNNAAADIFNIKNTGNVGVGTANPTDVNANARLTVAGISSQDVIASTTDNTTLSDAIFRVYAPGSSLFLGSHGTNQITTQYGITVGGWGEIGAVNSTFGTSNGLLIGTRTTNTPVVFGTNSSERVRILGTGNVGVASTSPFAKFSIQGESNNSQNTLFAIGSSTANATTTLFSVNNIGSTTLSKIPSSVLYTNSANTIVGTPFTTNGFVLALLNGVPTWTATSSINNGVTSIATNNGLTGGTITTTGTIGLATINAGVLGAVTNGAVPTSQATSTLYGVGTNGFVLTEVNGVPTWTATSSIQNITLTTTGSSGASTLIGNTLNIPQYSGGGIGDPFTHPFAGQSATTSLMQFFGQASTSQFTATSSVYLATLGGKVGIASTSPLAQLSIQSLYTASSTPLAQVNIIGSSSPAFYVGSPNQNGYVGIGTNNPTNPLVVAMNTGTGNSVIEADANNGQDAQIALVNSFSGKGAYLKAFGNSNFVSLEIQGTASDWKFGEFGSTDFSLLDGTNVRKIINVQLGAPADSLDISSAGAVTVTNGGLVSIVSSGSAVPGTFTSNSASTPIALVVADGGFADPNPILKISSINGTDSGTTTQITNAGTGYSFEVDDQANDTSPFVVDTTGKTGVSTSTPWRTFSVVGTVALNGLTAASTGNAVCINATTKDIEDAGTINCTVSSRLAKHDIYSIPDNVADEVLKLRPVGYTLNGTDEKRYGFIADEVAKVDPMSVFYALRDMTITGADGKPAIVKKGEPYSVDYLRYVALLTAEVQLQEKQIRALGGGKMVRSVEENYQWIAIGLLGLWNLHLTFRRRKGV